MPRGQAEGQFAAEAVEQRLLRGDVRERALEPFELHHRRTGDRERLAVVGTTDAVGHAAEHRARGRVEAVALRRESTQCRFRASLVAAQHVERPGQRRCRRGTELAADARAHVQRVGAVRQRRARHADVRPRQTKVGHRGLVVESHRPQFLAVGSGDRQVEGERAGLGQRDRQEHRHVDRATGLGGRLRITDLGQHVDADRGPQLERRIRRHAAQVREGARDRLERHAAVGFRQQSRDLVLHRGLAPEQFAAHFVATVFEVQVAPSLTVDGPLREQRGGSGQRADQRGGNGE